MWYFKQKFINFTLVQLDNKVGKLPAKIYSCPLALI